MGPRYGRRAVAFFKRFFKWIGRGAKKVGGFIKKHWKKVLPIALLAASAFFTFGISLGAINGAWSAKVGTLVSKLGITGKIGNILSGAIVQAGRGALLGGLTGTVTGQGFVRGAAAGAAIGAVTGGVTGAIRPVAPGLPGGQPAGAAGPGSAGNPIGSANAPGGVLPSTALGTLAEAAPRPSAFGSVWEKVIGSGGLGPIIQGVGAGIGRGLDQKARDKRDDERRDSYNIEYKPIAPMFSNESGRILATRVGEA